jgi:hypothetical protein
MISSSTNPPIASKRNFMHLLYIELKTRTGHVRLFQTHNMTTLTIRTTENLC